MSALTIKSLYDTSVYKNFIDRLNKLDTNTTPQWGEMSAAQMLAHCAEIQEVCNGKELKKTPFFLTLIRGFIKKMVINDQPYKHNLPTHPQYKVNDEHDFEKEKQRFLDALEQFKKDEKKNITHPFFGDLSADERGWAMYKHHTHHFDQFGI